MVQKEVVELLKKEKCPLSRTEIAEKLDDNKDKVTRALKNLIRFNEIEYVEIDRRIALVKYNVKRRMRLYYKKIKEEEK